MIKATSNIQQIPQEVTYGENLVKDNSIALSAKIIGDIKIIRHNSDFFNKSCNSFRIFNCLDFLEKNEDNLSLRERWDVPTRHFWWYIYHTTRPHKPSTSLEDDPKDFSRSWCHTLRCIENLSHEFINFTTTGIVENNYTEYHITEYPLIFV